MDRFNSEMQKLFPADTKIIDCKGESVTNYSATVRLRCTTKEEFKSWLNEHQNLSGNTYRVAVTKPRLGKTVVYKAVYRCQHNTYPTSHRDRVKSASKKHTGCNAKLNVTIKSSTENRVVKSKDCYRGEYPTIVTILNNHNHGISVAEAVKFKDPNESVKQKFVDLFRGQHGSSKALDYLYKRDLLQEYEDDHFIASDNNNLEENWYNSFVSNEIPLNELPTNVSLESPECKSVKELNDVDLLESYKWEDSQLKLDEITEILKNNFKKNPKDCTAAINAMHNMVTTMKTETSLFSAMHNFGKVQFKS